MKLSITTPARTAPYSELLRSKVADARTKVIGGYVCDRITGECYGEYITSVYTPEPITYTKGAPAKSAERWYIEDDGTVASLGNSSPPSGHLARVIELTPQKSIEEGRSSSTRGPKPKVIYNPLATALQILKFERESTQWLDDIAFGAIYTGPGVINGKQSVSLADVKKVLRLPIISTTSAAKSLLNHERQPMCTRQVERVVEAARTALRGIALYLERHPDILMFIDVTVDFEKLWEIPADHSEPAANNEHPMKQQALEMLRSQVPIQTIANRLGVARNTVKKWNGEA